MTFIDFWQERNAADYTVQPMQRHGKIIFLFSSHGNLLFSFVFFFEKEIGLGIFGQQFPWKLGFHDPAW